MQQYNRQVLMLEEDPDDRYLTNETVRELNLQVSIQFFTSGDDLLHALTSATVPSIVLIDYNSSGQNSLTVLQDIKNNPRFAHIPVIILSDSNLPQYVSEGYASGANTFIKKPGSMEETRTKIETFFKYWLQVAELQSV